MEYKAEFSPLMGSTEYLILLICMMGIIAVLLLWRQKIARGINAGMFAFMRKDSAEDIKIVAHKALDVKNRVVVLECEGSRYVILVGTHSVLLDKIPITKSPTKDFQEILKQQSAGNESTHP